MAAVITKHSDLDAYFAESVHYIIESAKIGLWDWDILTGDIVFSRQWLDLVGYGDGESPATIDAMTQLIHPEDKPVVLHMIADFLSGEADSFDNQFRLIRKDGTIIWIYERGIHTGRDSNGKPLRMLGITQDISSLKKMEEEAQQAKKDLEDTQQLNRLLFDANPYINVVVDNQFHVLDCNPQAVEYFGFSSADELRTNWTARINEAIPKHQADGRESIPLMTRYNDAIRNGFVDFETELWKDNRLTPSRVIFKKIPWKDSFAIAIYLVDLLSLKEAKNELVRRDRLLRIINENAAKLLASDPGSLGNTVLNFLKNIASAVDASRVSVCENFQENGKLLRRLLFEWDEGSDESKDQSSGIIYCFDDIPQIRDSLMRNITVNDIISNRGPEEQAVMSARGTHSILIIPLFYQGNFWGSLSFEDCQEERYFPSSEESAIHSAGVLIVSAIIRNKITQNLIRAREEALISSRAKSEFLSRMSHEIRTPMNAIIGMTAIALRSNNSEKMKYCLEKIENASGQLLGIINDILDMSKIEANKFEIMQKEFNFERMIENMVNMIHVKANEKKQHLFVDFDETFSRSVISDELRLGQVILNLLSNAVKFTPENGNITLKIGQQAIGGEKVLLRVEVIDTGIGVSDEQKERLFSSFEQADGSITRKYGGTGLGLALCKKIISLMGGNIWLESEFGKGSTFIFEVTVELGGECRSEEELQEINKGIRILSVDNDNDTLEYMNHVLDIFSVVSHTANNGEKALAMIRSSLDSGTPYNIVFMDWKLPDMDGAAIAREIKEMAGESITIVIMSAADWTEVEPGITGLGINFFLQKPILPSALHNTIVAVSGNGLAETGKSNPSGIDLSSRKFLVVEDIKINQEIIEGILEGTGVSLDFANNGIEAVDIFNRRGNVYDLILMDMQMPELDGLGATRQIRSFAAGTNSNAKWAAEIPIIAMTANAFSEDIDHCLEAGMNDHVAKPIDVDGLLTAISRHLKPVSRINQN